MRKSPDSQWGHWYPCVSLTNLFWAVLVFLDPYRPLILPLSPVLHIYTGKATGNYRNPTFLQSTISLTLREAFSHQRIKNVPWESVYTFPASAFPSLGILFGDPSCTDTSSKLELPENLSAEQDFIFWVLTSELMEQKAPEDGLEICYILVKLKIQRFKNFGVGCFIFFN